jgi:hypothetical protein
MVGGSLGGFVEGTETLSLGGELRNQVAIASCENIIVE